MRACSTSTRWTAINAPAVARGSLLSAALRPSESGTYVVSWQIFAADTHPSRGAFRFVVGSPTNNPYATLLDSPEIGTATPAIIACDCNAKPEAPELKLINDSGFGDLALQSGGGDNTFPSAGPTERIDYIFGIGVIAAQGHVVDSTASDHRAVVVSITLSVR